MKKLLLILALAVLLCGCSQQQTFEPVTDVYADETAQLQHVVLKLPENAVVQTMEHESAGMLYLCDGYCVTVQTFPGGDMERTMREVTGFSKEQLMVMQTNRNGVVCNDAVWSTAGEGEDQVCRTTVLDDGAYHYVVCAMADASAAGELSDTWNDIFTSVELVSTAP